MTNPSMVSRGKKPLLVIPVNGSYILGVYEGQLSKFDILIKYRQLDSSKKSGWSHIRTPKHIHWAVDILLKMQSNEAETKRFLDFLIHSWNTTVKPIKTENDRNALLDLNALLNEVNLEANNYLALAENGEYSIKFLILIAKLLMIQEKTNKESAYMFKQLLEALKEGEDIFKIVRIATHH